MTDYTVSHNGTIKWGHEGSQYCLHVQTDEDPINPAEEDSLVQMPCWGRHSNIGNIKTKGLQPDEWWHRLVRQHVGLDDVVDAAKNDKLRRTRVRPDDDGPDRYKICLLQRNGSLDTIGTNIAAAGLGEAVVDELSVPECRDVLKDHIVSLPVLCYEHSGVTISCDNGYPYNDQFDGGQIGWAVIDKKTVLENWPSVDDWKAKGEEIIRGFIKICDQYLTGDVWFFTLLKRDPESGEWQEEDSCGGFFGDGLIASGMADNVGHGLKEAVEAGDFTTGTAKQVVIRYYNYDD